MSEIGKLKGQIMQQEGKTQHLSWSWKQCLYSIILVIFFGSVMYFKNINKHIKVPFISTFK